MTTATYAMSSYAERVSERRPPDDSSFLNAQNREAHRVAWQKVLDDHLIDWATMGPERWDGELVPPTRESILAAAKLVRRLSDAGHPQVFAVVPSGDGGIVFEEIGGRNFQVFEISESGDAEFRVFRNSALVGRWPCAV